MKPAVREQITDRLWEALKKAVQHKYVRKYRRGGRWVYVYPKDGDRHGKHSIAQDRLIHDDHLQEGAAFSAGAGEGHLHIESIEGGKLTIRNDETGETQTLTKAQFKKQITGAHKDAIRRHTVEGLQRRSDLLWNAHARYPDAPATKRAMNELQRWADRARGAKDPTIAGEVQSADSLLAEVRSKQGAKRGSKKESAPVEAIRAKTPEAVASLPASAGPQDFHGSAKQQEWAHDIYEGAREGLVHALDAGHTLSSAAGAEASVSRVAEMRAHLTQHRSARWWVDNRSALSRFHQPAKSPEGSAQRLASLQHAIPEASSPPAPVEATSGSPERTGLPPDMRKEMEKVEADWSDLMGHSGKRSVASFPHVKGNMHWGVMNIYGAVAGGKRGDALAAVIDAEAKNARKIAEDTVERVGGISEYGKRGPGTPSPEAVERHVRARGRMISNSIDRIERDGWTGEKVSPTPETTPEAPEESHIDRDTRRRLEEEKTARAGARSMVEKLAEGGLPHAAEASHLTEQFKYAWQARALRKKDTIYSDGEHHFVLSPEGIDRTSTGRVYSRGYSIDILVPGSDGKLDKRYGGRISLREENVGRANQAAIRAGQLFSRMESNPERGSHSHDTTETVIGEVATEAESHRETGAPATKEEIRQAKAMVRTHTASEKLRDATPPTERYTPDHTEQSRLTGEKLTKRLEKFAGDGSDMRSDLEYAHADGGIAYATDGHRIVGVRTGQVDGRIPLRGAHPGTVAREMRHPLATAKDRKIIPEPQPDRQHTFTVRDLKAVIDGAAGSKQYRGKKGESVGLLLYVKGGQLHAQQHDSHHVSHPAVGLAHSSAPGTIRHRRADVAAAVDHTYLRDALIGLRGNQTVTIQTPIDPRSPFRIDRPGGEFHVIMPMEATQIRGETLKVSHILPLSDLSPDDVGQHQATAAATPVSKALPTRTVLRAMLMRARRILGERTQKGTQKYCRRTGPPGHRKYVYPDSNGKCGGDHRASEKKLIGEDKDYHEGAVFADGKGGHYHVTAVHGNMIELSLDGGKTLSMERDTFKTLLRGNHAEAIKAHAEHGLARRKELLEMALTRDPTGTAPAFKRATNELKRWREKHADILGEKEAQPEPGAQAQEAAPEQAPEPQQEAAPEAEAPQAEAPAPEPEAETAQEADAPEAEAEDRPKTIHDKRREFHAQTDELLSALDQALADYGKKKRGAKQAADRALDALNAHLESAKSAIRPTKRDKAKLDDAFERFEKAEGKFNRIQQAERDRKTKARKEKAERPHVEAMRASAQEVKDFHEGGDDGYFSATPERHEKEKETIHQAVEVLLGGKKYTDAARRSARTAINATPLTPESLQAVSEELMQRAASERRSGVQLDIRGVARDLEDAAFAARQARFGEMNREHTEATTAWTQQRTVYQSEKLSKEATDRQIETSQKRVAQDLAAIESSWSYRLGLDRKDEEVLELRSKHDALEQKRVANKEALEDLEVKHLSDKIGWEVASKTHARREKFIEEANESSSYSGDGRDYSHSRRSRSDDSGGSGRSSGRRSRSSSRGRGSRRKARSSNPHDNGGLYTLLGVEPGATAHEIKMAHRKKIREHHTDTGGDTEAIQHVNAAHDILSDDEVRAHYDEHGSVEATEKFQAQKMRQRHKGANEGDTSKALDLAVQDEILRRAFEILMRGFA